MSAFKKKELLQSLMGFFNMLRGLLIWLFPFMATIVFPALFCYVFKKDFDKYFELVKIIIWPSTILISLFFFRKVVTYLFFSMDEFNFFGARGSLKNINSLIEEKVDEKINEINRSKSIEEKFESYEMEIQKRDESIKGHKDNAKGNFKLASEILGDWRKSVDENKNLLKVIERLKRELKERANIGNNTTVRGSRLGEGLVEGELLSNAIKSSK